MVRHVPVVLLLSGCGSWLPGVPEPNTASTTDPTSTTAMWSAFVGDVEAASVVRAYYSWQVPGGMGTTHAMVTVDDAGRAAIDHRFGSRFLLHDGELKAVAGDGFGELLEGPIDATGWDTAISLGLNHLSSVPTTLWGPDLPAHHQETFPDLGTSVQVRLDIGGDDAMNLGMTDGGHVMKAVFDNADGTSVGYRVHHVVLDPVLPSDFFEPGGTVHADGSDTLWRGP